MEQKAQTIYRSKPKKANKAKKERTKSSFSGGREKEILLPLPPFPFSHIPVPTSRIPTTFPPFYHHPSSSCSAPPPPTTHAAALPAVLWLAAAAAAAWALFAGARPAGAAWCIARSGAPEKALQTALDYACGPAGRADCAPIQASGLCYLPNTLAAHSSYAFNSIFQRSRAAPGACDFAGTATITLTDPSFGSCTYPASPSTAGQSGLPGSGTTTPSTPPGTDNDDNGGAGGLSTDDSNAEARVAAVPLLPLALSCLVYLHLPWW